MSKVQSPPQKKSSLAAEENATPNYPETQGEALKRKAQRECNSNPFCFNGDWEFRPAGRFGYEVLFGSPTLHHFNLGTKLLFFNRELGKAGGDNSFGIGPEAQLHTGPGRDAGSFGLALRFRRQIGVGEFAGFLNWGLDLSVRGGVGHLEFQDGENQFEGGYQMIAADLSLFGTLAFLSAYAGVGLRKEYWPHGTDTNGREVDFHGSNLYPALTVGLGIF